MRVTLQNLIRCVGAGILGAALNALSVSAAPIETPAPFALLMDIRTGAVLFEKNADQPLQPASMSKIMTAFMVFERLKAGHLSLDHTFPVSEKAWRTGGSKMFLEVGKDARVEDLLRGVIVQSGNDASIVLAEGLAGSEEAFAEKMTQRAHQLGMKTSQFKNATGLPDPEHVMTARELALLVEHTITEFPDYYHYYSEISFTFNGIKQGNRNPLLYKNLGADGLKTGHTESAGYGLAASAERDGRRLVLVLHGLENDKKRAQEAERILEFGFREFENYALFKAGDVVENAEVWLGEAPTVPLIVPTDVVVTLPRAERRALKVAAVYAGPVPAPISKGTPIATLVVSTPATQTLEVPLVAGAEIDKLGLLGRLGATLDHLLWGQRM